MDAVNCDTTLNLCMSLLRDIIKIETVPQDILRSVELVHKSQGHSIVMPVLFQIM